VIDKMTARVDPAWFERNIGAPQWAALLRKAERLFPGFDS
jgi:hypothetical protein